MLADDVIGKEVSNYLTVRVLEGVAGNAAVDAADKLPALLDRVQGRTARVLRPNWHGNNENEQHAGDTAGSILDA